MQRPRPEILPCDFRKATGGINKGADGKQLSFLKGFGAGSLEVAMPGEKPKGGFCQVRRVSGPGMETIVKGVAG